MEETDRSKLVEELTLALLYLTSFTEKPNPDTRFAWKTHDWAALDALAEDGFIVPPRCKRTYSRQLTDEGIEKAKQLLEKISPALGFSKKIDD